ncbi:MAG: hypothetical protein FJ090_11660 [Deltaproteobacteria bacterium]|nr:hypothetical protein [Deltaproteobacteria bacterium]
MWVALLIACQTDDAPVVSGVPGGLSPTTPEAVAEKRKAEEVRTSPRNLEVNYEKPRGVYIDVHFLGGRTVDNVAHVIVDQLGTLQEDRDHLEGKHELVYERGTLTTVDGAILVIDVPLPEPLRRAEALATTGFNPLVDNYLSFTREFRVTQFMDFRRIVLKRAEPNGELVNRVVGYKRQQGAAGRALED